MFPCPIQKIKIILEVICIKGDGGYFLFPPDLPFIIIIMIIIIIYKTWNI